MIESSIDKISRQGYIVLCPNMSSRWSTTKKLLWFFAGFDLLIGLGFAIFGLWLILPFVGLEIILLSSLCYWVAYQCCRKEVVLIENNQVVIEKGYRFPVFRWQSELFWVRLDIKQPGYRGHPQRVFLKSRDQRIELGAFLNDEDKKQLIAELRSVISQL